MRNISIKYKIPIVIYIMFLLLLLIVLLYYRFYALKYTKETYIETQNVIENISKNVSKDILNVYPDTNKIDTIINSYMDNTKINITLYDANDKIIFNSKKSSKDNINIGTKEFISIDGKLKYILDIEHSYNLRKIVGFSSGSGILLFTLIVLFVLLLIIVIYLHYLIVKPLVLLKNQFETVNYKKNIFSNNIKRFDEIGNLYQNFDIMLRKLEYSYKQQIEIISSISHDLKTPLTSIMGYMERLINGTIKSENKKIEYYNIVLRKSQDIKTLIEEFSNYSKNEYYLINIKKNKVNLRYFLNSLNTEYSEELNGLNVNFTTEYNIPKNIFLFIDEKKIRRVFANLISNSLNYVKSPISITLKVYIENSMVNFIIEDNGEGIKENELNKIFNSFYRVDKSRSREMGGSGLGLSICKSIVESHLGSIEAYNKKIEGFVVKFSLPLK